MIQISHTAPLTCPSCGHEFTATWVGEKTGDQQCPACEHVFEATWPGFTFEPETVFVWTCPWCAHEVTTTERPATAECGACGRTFQVPPPLTPETREQLRRLLDLGGQS